MENKKIKIGHIHVEDEKNKGDVAIVQAVQSLLISHIAAPLVIEDFPMEILQRLDDADLSRLNACDLIVIGGGGIYYKYFLPYAVANLRKINPPIVIFGVGYIREIGSDGLGAAEKESLRELNSLAVLSSVRDFRTKDILVDLGIAAEKITIVGDSAIFLPETKIEAIKFDDNRIKIGLNLNYSGWLGFGDYEDMIIDSYNQVGNYFQEKFDARIFYLKHHPGEENIIGRLEVKNLEIIDLNPCEQKYAYAQLDLILGMMLHSAVLSFGAGTPFVNLGYDIRNKSFGDFIGSPELVIGADELKEGALMVKVLEIFSKREEYRKKFLRRKQEIWESQLNFLKKIEDLIKTS